MRGFKIARVFGIDIAIHPSWFIILAVLVWSLADNVFPSAYAWSRTTYWIVAVIAALLLFVSVLVHELAHSLIAKRQGIPVKSITLFVLGGVSNLEEEARSPGREALMAGAGPLSSLVIGGAALAVGRTLQAPETVRAVLLYLGSVNILLGVFNLLPGFPLDGGRVLRAALWKRSGDMLRATRGAARTGTVFGYLLIAAGVVMALLGSLLGGVWMGFVGWVLVQASRAAYEQTSTQARLGGVLVRELTTPALGLVPPDASLHTAAHDYFRPLHARCLPVGNAEVPLAGVLCVGDLRRAGRERWAQERVSEAMTPREQVVTVGPEATGAEALRLLTHDQASQAAVVEDGRLLGFVERSRLLRYGIVCTDPHDGESPATVGGSSEERTVSQRETDAA
jgi:Zn-dependent protease